MRYRFFLGGLFVVLFVSIILLWSPFLEGRWMNIYQDRVFQLRQCLADGQWPCRWVWGLERMYGSPLYNYIGPLPYYLGQFFFLITGKVSLAVRLLFGIGMVGSYFFAYSLIVKYRNDLVATVGGILYFLIVWFGVVQTFNDPLAKLWTVMLIPGVVLAVRRLSFRPTLLNGLLLAGLMAMVYLSRLNNLIQLTPLVVVLILLFWLYRRSWRFLIYCGVGLGLAIWMSAFYLLPVWGERQLAFLDPLTQDYVPQSSAIIPTEYPPAPYQLLAGQTNIRDFKQGSNWFSFRGDAMSHSIIRIYQFYYPNWVIKVDGREVSPNFESNSLGLITVLLGKGENQLVEGELRDTPIRQVGNILSLIGVGVFGLLLIWELRRTRRWLLYYLNALNW